MPITVLCRFTLNLFCRYLEDKLVALFLQDYNNVFLSMMGKYNHIYVSKLFLYKLPLCQVLIDFGYHISNFSHLLPSNSCLYKIVGATSNLNKSLNHASFIPAYALILAHNMTSYLSLHSTFTELLPWIMLLWSRSYNEISMSQLIQCRILFCDSICSDVDQLWFFTICK